MNWKARYKLSLRYLAIHNFIYIMWTEAIEFRDVDSRIGKDKKCPLARRKP
jgi:hypothetical protein